MSQSQRIFVGPGHVFVGDPTSASSMVHLGPTETITFNPGVQTTGVQTALTGDSYEANSVYSMPPSPELQCELYDASLRVLQQYVLGANKQTEDTHEAQGFGGEIKLVELPTVCVIHESEKHLGADAPSAIWIPAALITGLSGFTWNRMQANSNAGNAYTVTFRAARRRQDQGDAAITPSCQYAFMGSPAAIGLNWSLPSIA